MNCKNKKQLLFVIGFLMVHIMVAQQKLTKVSQSVKVDKDVTIDLNTSHCNIVFDTWNKDSVEIEAYIEGDGASKEDLEKALKSWEVDVDASAKEVSIKTRGGSSSSWAYKVNGNGDVDEVLLKELKFELAEVPEIDFDFEFDMPEAPKPPKPPKAPEVLKIPELPELPKGINKIQFDYEAYKKDGEKYIEEWSKNFESGFGKEYGEKMKVWGEKYSKEMAAWGERFAEQMEAHEKHIEHVRKHKEDQRQHVIVIKEELAKEREKMATEREKLADERRVVVEKIISNKFDSKIKKTIKIKMPKDAKLKVNVRHGELKFAANIDDLKADLSHTKFTANSINGSQTSINASYSPIYVNHWNLGELNLNYVTKAELNNVKRLVLTSNSSNVKIDNLLESAIIDENIGDLRIMTLGEEFTNLNIILQNSRAKIGLPQSDYNFKYKGTRSNLAHPKKTSGNNVSSYSINNSNTNKTIVINAKYSDVVMQ